MDLQRASELSRRSLLRTVGGIAAVAVVSQAVAEEKNAPDSDRVPPKMSEVRKEFERLLPLWQKERKAYGLSSNSYDYWKGPHGKAIIALGPAITPFLIQQVKAGEFLFNVPLALIAKVDIANGRYDSEQANSKLWVQWWETARTAPTE